MIDDTVTSPNCGPRRDGLLPTLIVLHYTAMHSAEAARNRLCDPSAEVSSHYLISRHGQIMRLVPEHLRAWHAGKGAWHGKEDINSRSIGIELDNNGTAPFAEPLMAALETLLPQIMQRWSIPAKGVIGHSDMAPGRKIDPGPKFDWARLAKNGLARSAGVTPQRDLHKFRALAENHGYTAPADDQTLLNTVRLRYRPWATGALCARDLAPFT